MCRLTSSLCLLVLRTVFEPMKTGKLKRGLPPLIYIIVIHFDEQSEFQRRKLNFNSEGQYNNFNKTAVLFSNTMCFNVSYFGFLNHNIMTNSLTLL